MDEISTSLLFCWTDRDPGPNRAEHFEVVYETEVHKVQRSGTKEVVLF